VKQSFFLAASTALVLAGCNPPQQAQTVAPAAAAPVVVEVQGRPPAPRQVAQWRPQAQHPEARAPAPRPAGLDRRPDEGRQP